MQAHYSYFINVGITSTMCIKIILHWFLINQNTFYLLNAACPLNCDYWDSINLVSLNNVTKGILHI